MRVFFNPDITNIIFWCVHISLYGAVKSYETNTKMRLRWNVCNWFWFNVGNEL